MPISCELCASEISIRNKKGVISQQITRLHQQDKVTDFPVVLYSYNLEDGQAYWRLLNSLSPEPTGSTWVNTQLMILFVSYVKTVYRMRVTSST